MIRRHRTFRLSEGLPFPLGATWDGLGVNFALFSANAQKVELCLFDSQGRRELERVALDLFARNGFAATTVDDIARAAGISRRTFFRYYSSKEDVLASVIDANLGRPFVEPGDGDLTTRRELLRAYLRRYISMEHRDDPGQGCVIPTLSADVARSGDAIREIYQQRMDELIGKIAPLMKGPRSAREKKAWSLLSMMVGSMVIARAMPDKKQAAKAIDSALESALESVGA